jgi:YidC/Oxa1 family membrane protein insertase
MEQKRLILWLAISTTIFVVWSYFFAPKPTNQNTNSSQQQQQSSSSPNPTVTPANKTEGDAPPAAITQTVSKRLLTISTPLFDAKFDNQGGVATSWIIKKNRETGKPLYGDKKRPLELISPKGLERREMPFQLFTGDRSIDALLNTKNYEIKTDGISSEGDTQINLNPGETRRVEFYMRDEQSKLEVEKILTFSGNDYRVAIETKILRNGEPVQNATIAIGPNIGDQTVREYTFYSVAPEAVAVINGSVNRYQAAVINSKHTDHVSLKGKVDWAAVGDTYFAMVAVPLSVQEGSVEYKTVMYEYEENGKKQPRYLVTGYFPVTPTSSKIDLFVGPKDFYILETASSDLTKAVGHPVNLNGLIDYGFGETISRPFVAPILWAIQGLYKLTNSYGVAIILFTIIIYSLFFPLKWRSSVAMKKAQKLAPRMKEVQEKMKGLKQNDPKLKELQVEQLRLMKEGNPLGGCLPILVQMPFLFALFRAITISIDFRHASFLWIPDLSSPEPYMIKILPLLMAGSMMVLQLITPAPSADPLQKKMMAIGMPVMMLWILWTSPAGLLVYWLVGNLVGFGQQFVINRIISKEEDNNSEPPGKKDETRSSKRLKTARAS